MQICYNAGSLYYQMHNDLAYIKNLQILLITTFRLEFLKYKQQQLTFNLGNLSIVFSGRKTLITRSDLIIPKSKRLSLAALKKQQINSRI